MPTCTIVNPTCYTASMVIGLEADMEEGRVVSGDASVSCLPLALPFPWPSLPPGPPLPLALPSLVNIWRRVMLV